MKFDINETYLEMLDVIAKHSEEATGYKVDRTDPNYFYSVLALSVIQDKFIEVSTEEERNTVMDNMKMRSKEFIRKLNEPITDSDSQ